MPVSPALSALLSWSAQAAMLTVAAALTALTVAHPKARLALWQGLLAVLMLLPLIEPWQARPVTTMEPGPDAGVTILAPATAAAHPARSSWRPEYWLWLIAAVAAVRLLWMGAGFLRLYRYRKQARRIADPLPFADRFISWYASDAVPGPVTYGWRNPVILLPSRTLDLPPDLREAIQCHELIHVRRGDWLWAVGETIVRSLLWFHPAIWVVMNRIHLCREQAVDREAIALLQNRERYLDALVAVAHYQLSPDLAPAPSFLRQRQLVARVRAVMEEVPMSRSRIITAAAATCSLLPLAAYAAMWLFPFSAVGQTVADGPDVKVNPGGVLLHRPPVFLPAGVNVSGTVTLDATLAPNGEVTDARVLSGPEELRKTALSNVLEWHYQPGPSHASVSIQFTAASAQAAAQSAVVPVPRPPAPASTGFPATVKSINIVGLTPEAEQQLRSRLAVREGDSVTGSDIDHLRNAAREFDEHLNTTYQLSPAPTGGSQVDLTLRAPARAQIVSIPPPPPPPAPGVRNVPVDAVTVSPAVQAAKVTNAPKPAYPPIAKQARIQGAVILQAVIAKDGSVQSLQVLSSQNPLLTQAAVDAVKQWTYQPTILNNQPVAVATTVTVNFTLQD